MGKQERNMQILAEGKALFEAHKRELMDAGLEGQYFLAKDGLFSTYATASEALAAGYKRFGMSESFLMQQILPEERVESIVTPGIFS